MSVEIRKICSSCGRTVIKPFNWIFVKILCKNFVKIGATLLIIFKRGGYMTLQKHLYEHSNDTVQVKFSRFDFAI